MKKIRHLNILHYQSLIGVSALLTGSLLLSGCQSTNMGSSTTNTASMTPSAAKTALATALQQQRRQSFSYHTNLEISNAPQFNDIDGKQLVASDDVDSHCEETHDAAYAAIVVQAETQDKEVLSTDYSAQRATIKQSYLECAEAYQAWEDNHYDSEAYIAEAADDDAVNMGTVIESEVQAASEFEETSSVSPYYEQLFTEYDSKQTKLDIKKAQLLDAYVLKPLSMNAQGVYQPAAGKFTMLPSVQYLARNNHTSINQPIYVDFKTGNIYLWADNFALFTSELADDKLGTKWQNKWLKLTIDDGTLPKGFGRSVIKSYFEVLDSTYEKAPSSQFDFIAPNTLTTLAPKLSEQHLIPMLQSQKIIRRVQSFEQYQQSYKGSMRTFYELISKQYPELVTESDMSEELQHSNGSDDTRFTSKDLVQQALAMIKGVVDNDSELVKIEAADSVDLKAPVQELYGFNQKGQIKWQHLHSQLSRTSRAEANDSMTINILHQYAPIKAQDMAFPNLPSNMQIPNASNSIDLRDYSNELVEYYRKGNGTALGKILFNKLPIQKNQLDTAPD